MSITNKGAVTIVDGDNKVTVNDDNQLYVVLDGKIDTGNSSTALLDADEVFTGEACEILNYSIVFINVYSDVSSATDGLVIEQSSDGTNWDHNDIYTIDAAIGKNFSINPHARYFRVKYTNGGSNQGTFRLQSILKKTNAKPSSHRIQDNINDDDDATLQKSVLTAKDPNEIFVNIQATDSDNLRVTDAENGLAIAKGDVANTEFIHKFGYAPEFATADNTIDIWDGADESGIDEMVYTYSATAAIDSLSSSNDTDTQDIEIQGLDANYAVVIQTITITGQTRKALDTNLIRIFRMKNVGSTDLAGYLYCYENTAIASGVPIDTSKIRAVIQNGFNQTLMALYTIPANVTGYMRDWYASTAGANKSSNYIVDLYARPFGEVFQLKYKSAIENGGTSYIQHRYQEPEVFTQKTDIAMRVTSTGAGVTGAAISAGFDIVLIDN